ncbi:hypothetical protein [Vacuolonema iberomarrocanum]
MPLPETVGVGWNLGCNRAKAGRSLIELPIAAVLMCNASSRTLV